MHIIAGKAVAFLEALKPEFKEYCHQIIKNAKTLEVELKKYGFNIVTGGTDNHLILIDLRKNFPNLNGKVAQNALDAANITTNKNTVPGESRSPFKASGIRLGTPAVTSRGMKEEDMVKVAEFIDRAVAVREDEAALRAIGEEVKEFMTKFPMPQF